MQKIEPDVVSAVKADWFRKLLKKLSEGKPFDMEGLNVVYAIDANKSATEDDARRLQRDFAAMQWESNIWFRRLRGGVSSSVSAKDGCSLDIVLRF